MKYILDIISARMRAFKQFVSPIIGTFSHREKIAFEILLVVFVAGSVSLLYQVNNRFLAEVPRYGGQYSEGIIGVPRFINPLLAISDADRDLTALVYSGLVRTVNGVIIPDLAESYSISDEGRVYTFVLKENLVFHDGTPVTTDDVEFTVKSAQDPLLRSVKRASWDDVKIEKVNAREIKFILKQPYAPFLENATLGILPKHIWKDAAPEEFAFSQFNISPVGTGPYQVSNIVRDSSGIPEYYTLSSFRRFALGRPYIDTLELHLYPNEKTLVSGLKKGDILGASSVSSHTATELAVEGFNTIRSPLPRVFAVFFNQNQNALFTEKNIREALSLVVDKKSIVNEILSGYGTPLDGPIPPGSLGYLPSGETPKTHEENLALAREKIEKGGWKWNEERKVFERKVKKETQTLSFSLSTSDIGDLKETATLLKRSWEELGIPVDLKIFDENDLRQNVIRPRSFDALLFGEVVGRESDLYPFWHSSQRNDPGLNVGLYANIVADKLLTEGRALSSHEDRVARYVKFAEEIKKDVPAVFLYAPDFIYIVPDNIQGVSLTSAAIPPERWNNVYQWFIETDKVWKVFLPKAIN